MSHYVMLNFEDPNPDQGGGALKASSSANPAGAGGAAAGTVGIYHRRAKKKSSIFKKKTVSYYSCLELLAADRNNTLSNNDLANVRKDCADSKTIGVIIHGQPTDTDNGFSTAGNVVCNWSELADLALKLLPARSKPYNIALVMCYGARSDDPRLDHRGNLTANDLKTSFAYKFFRQLCQSRNVRMTARTGAVSNDNLLNHTVETEEQVFFVLDRRDAMNQRSMNMNSMNQQKDALFQQNKTTKDAFGKLLEKFLNNPNLAPNGEVETFAKQYIIYSPYMSGFIQNKYQNSTLGNRQKYGKLIYTYDGVLQIVARYDDGQNGRGPNHVLYHGPLL